VSGTGFIEAEEHGYAPGDPVTLTPTETYRALVGALREISEELPCERPCEMVEKPACRSCGHQPYRSWCSGCVARRALALLREADTGEGT
jgi:hypothetical protein